MTTVGIKPALAAPQVPNSKADDTFGVDRKSQAKATDTPAVVILDHYEQGRQLLEAQRKQLVSVRQDLHILYESWIYSAESVTEQSQKETGLMKLIGSLNTQVAIQSENLKMQLNTFDLTHPRLAPVIVYPFTIHAWVRSGNKSDTASAYLLCTVHDATATVQSVLNQIIRKEAPSCIRRWSIVHHHLSKLPTHHVVTHSLADLVRPLSQFIHNTIFDELVFYW